MFWGDRPTPRGSLAPAEEQGTRSLADFKYTRRTRIFRVNICGPSAMVDIG